MRALALCLLAPLAACNQLLGLDDTSIATDGGDDVDDPRDGATGDADDGPDARACPAPGSAEFVDEDADGVADTCDGCPATPDADQLDGDGDGVGDACDPAAGGRTRIAFFDGFHGARDPAWVEAGTGGWTVVDDALELSDGTVLSSITVDGLAVAEARVEAPMVVRALPTAIDHVTGVLFAATGSNGYLCAADRRGTTTTADLYIYEVTTTRAGLTGALELAGVFAVDARLAVRGTWSAGTQSCSIAIDGGTPQAVSSGDTTYGAGSVGVYAQGVAVRVPYVIVYEETAD